MAESIRVKTALAFSFILQLIFFTSWLSSTTVELRKDIESCKILAERALLEVEKNELRIRKSELDIAKGGR